MRHLATQKVWTAESTSGSRAEMLMPSRLGRLYPKDRT
jgi:hypothetical protein